MRDPDLPTMDEALDWLASRNVPHRKASDYQIKIGRDLNWWPAKGTIVIDGAKTRYSQSGKQALTKLLTDQKIMRP